MNVHCYLLVALATLSSVQSQSVLNWFWSSSESQAVVSDGVPLISIPYESLTEDEKFLKEASNILTPATRPLCGARTRSGNPCRLLSSKGQNYCHRHATGGSVIGD
ncbi:unnamed protein product [Trichogramma brassicae]|uniref:Uncharacterized protein n=1 Tax=Trichogramma brassicae TaxID=86971 RepID=A0A6H5I911_9HYME|nr:unnamed protein product [Trichogramma brassicae]